MKLSVETKVAAAIAAAFTALAAIAIAQNNEGGMRVPNSYSPTSNPKVNTYITQQEDGNDLQRTLWVDSIRL
jgi:hypothetical protein